MSTGGTKQTIWIDCGMHAREWIAPAMCQYFLDQLTSGYGSDSEITALVDTYDFHIMPVVNPDGYEYTWTDVSGTSVCVTDLVASWQNNTHTHKKHTLITVV